MSKHKLTAVLYQKSKQWPYKEELVEELDESFFSIYNATRRESELYYLGYTNIKLVPNKSFKIWRDGSGHVETLTMREPDHSQASHLRLVSCIEKPCD